MHRFAIGRRGISARAYRLDITTGEAVDLSMLDAGIDAVSEIDRARDMWTQEIEGEPTGVWIELDPRGDLFPLERLEGELEAALRELALPAPRSMHRAARDYRGALRSLASVRLLRLSIELESLEEELDSIEPLEGGWSEIEALLSASSYLPLDIHSAALSLDIDRIEGARESLEELSRYVDDAVSELDTALEELERERELEGRIERARLEIEDIEAALRLP